ncbi:alpha/beta hydrolase [Hymenobacter lapidiphilus]|uniref:alpha/beta fold hydrolase n=1 Tax=Hymenobacter sp. CCM 8763 TaxID=2303334 RepID=UPI000E346DFC|nr:alpha/beta hydrolase [Hymenobacter sp. CCM 8763]RFP63441.1 alpha/beta hydrolase [Hymenobacter sp. CCM 8763]
MNHIIAGQDTHGNDVKLDYIDHGAGKPVVLIHGWPATYKMWEYQLTALTEQGFRVVAYTRRGFGNSSKPFEGHDYDTYADDLKAVLDKLDLQDVTLVGFSMGGGEVARYMSRHGGARVSRVAFVSAVTPFLLKTTDNPEGVDRQVFDEMIERVKEDRFDFLQGFGKKFYGVGMLSNPVSEAALDWTQRMCEVADPRATVLSARAWSETDFRQDLATIQVPALVIHGGDDALVPAKVSGERMTHFVPHAEFIEYAGAPHGLFIPEKERLNRDLITFVHGGDVQKTADRY